MFLPLELKPLGGYIPYVNLPCERNIGESLAWLAAIAVLPLNCKLVPWLCCPVPVEPTDKITVSLDITCDDPRAPLGGFIHWTMVGMSLFGLLFSLVKLGECALVQTGVLSQYVPNTFVLAFEQDPAAPVDPITYWYNALEKALQQFQNDYLIHDTNYNGNYVYSVTVPASAIPPGSFLEYFVNFGRPSWLTSASGRAMQDAAVSATNSEASETEFNSQNFIDEQNETLANRLTSMMPLILKKLTPENATHASNNTFSGLPPITTRKKRAIDSLLSSPRSISNNSLLLRRVRRQAILDVPVSVSRSFYAGPDEIPDKCGRNKVSMEDDDDQTQADDEEDDDDDDDDCYEVLSRGPCDDTEFVLVDPFTKKGVCGPRLCSPDRVFLYSDQLCHDPLEVGVCPPGRQLFAAGFGTPVCGCPDGFYELKKKDDDYDDDDDDDTDVCQPLLTKTPHCDSDKVFFFKSFRSPPECVADPCNGLNLNRDDDDFPFVPSLKDGNCYQLGSHPDICQDGEFYALDLPKLKGVCQSLDDAGYLTLDSSTLKKFIELYGAPLSEAAPATLVANNIKSKPSKVPLKSINWDKMTIGVPVVPPLKEYRSPTPPLMIGQSVLAKFPEGSWPQWAVKPTHVTAYSPPFLAINGNVTINVFGSSGIKFMKDSNDTSFSVSHKFKSPIVQQLQSSNAAHTKNRRAIESSPFKGFYQEWYNRQYEKNRNFLQKNYIPTQQIYDVRSPTTRSHSEHQIAKLSRRKRAPHASPSNVFEPALAACRAGAVRDINQKCRDTLLPSTFKHRPRRATLPTKPSPDCPKGGVRTIQRRCTSNLDSVQSSIIATGLG